MTHTQAPNVFVSEREQAQAAAKALRAAVLATVPEGLVAKTGEFTDTVFFSTTAKYTSRDDVASVTFEVTSRGYRTVMQVTVRPSWNFNRATRRAVSYWADRTKDYAVDPAKVVAKLQALLVALREQEAREVELRKWRSEEAKKTTESVAPVLAFMNEHDVKVGWTNDCRVREWNGSSSGRFSVKLDNLTVDQMLAVLAVVKD